MSDDFLGERVLGLGTDFIFQMLPKFQDFQNQQVQYVGVVVTTLIPFEGPLAEVPILNTTGNQPDESLPSTVAAILSLRSGNSGKTNRGRLYIGGIGENEHAAGRLLPDAFTSLNDIGNGLYARFGLSGSSPYFNHVIYSRLHGIDEGQWTAGGIRIITQYVPRQVLGTQRHRLIGHGT